ncbi:MAG TPA: DUF3558 domain-containing protein [Pseudonocardiaceae bacterium]|nr:DUF3558 domain-containing protein [Pseudonocardiaceae bacterium]
MRRLAAGLALLAVGSGAQTSAPAPQPPVGDASRVDMCTVLTDAELTGLGNDVASRKPVNHVGLIGCRWLGSRYTLDLERDKDKIASYQARQRDPAFTSFATNTVNGRAGVRISVRPDRTDCVQFFDGGSVSLVVQLSKAGLYTGPPLDWCGEAMRIARMIEPRLPKVGG